MSDRYVIALVIFVVICLGTSVFLCWKKESYVNLPKPDQNILGFWQEFMGNVYESSDNLINKVYYTIEKIVTTENNEPLTFILTSRDISPELFSNAKTLTLDMLTRHNVPTKYRNQILNALGTLSSMIKLYKNKQSKISDLFIRRAAKSFTLTFTAHALLSQK
jgi:hypothetical protein